jgi:hypothetical protein
MSMKRVSACGRSSPTAIATTPPTASTGTDIAATAIVSEQFLLAADARHLPRAEGLELQLVETA